MKKPVMKKKKKIIVMKQIKRAAVLFMALFVTAGNMTASAQEEQTVTFVYHKHIGNAQEEGGCYGTAVYHCHKGNEIEGGNCFETPVYHSHIGDETVGGDCYGTPVFHVHEGDDSQEGGCYEAVYHVHEGSCYSQVSSQEYGCYVKKTVDTSDGDYEGNDYKYYYMSCGEVVHGTNASHSHSILTCSDGERITGYALACGKTEESIDSYSLDCEKTEETIDGYSLSCERTEADIDGYEINCGRDEETPVGKIITIKEKTADESHARIKVSFEDLSEGEVALSEAPFLWFDEQGNTIGTGEEIEISENGTYHVVLHVLNDNINEESLRADITVNSIKKTAFSDPRDEENDSEGEGDGIGADALEGNVPLPTLSPSPTPTAVVASTQSSGGASTLKQSNDRSSEIDTEKREVASPAPVWEKREQTIMMEERQSENEEILPIETLELEEENKQTTFFASPVVKLITITTGTFLLLAGLCTLFYLFRWSVSVYNDDGKGNMIYLGRTRVKLQEEGYTIQISDGMVEKALTNRYCIKPGLFGLFKDEKEELLVEKGSKRIAVFLSREMIVVI